MYQKFLKLALGAVTALSLLSGAATAAEWRGWNIHVEGYPNTIAMDKFAELLAEKTNGEITLQMFHGGTLGSQPDAIEQVRLGGLESATSTSARSARSQRRRTSFRFPSSSRTCRTVPRSRRRRRQDDRRGHGGQGPRGAELVRRRGALLLQCRQADQRAGGRVRNEGAGHEQRPLLGHDLPARRQPVPDGLRRGLPGAQDRSGRRRGEQLAVLRIDRAFRGGRVLLAQPAPDHPPNASASTPMSTTGCRTS